MDASKVLIGLSGQKAIPSTVAIKSPETFIFRGSIRNWDLVRRAWQRCFETMVLTPGNPRGLITALPCNCTQAEIERIVDVLFTEYPISSLFMMNPWMAVLLNANRRTGVVIFVEETATVVVSVVNMCTIAQSVNFLSLGTRDISDQVAPSLQRFVENIQAVS